MLFFAFGSLLFGFALICAVAVTCATFVQYRAQMIAALRTLSLDGLDRREQTGPSPSGLAVKIRLDRPVRPAPRLAA